jgi:methionyl-tRNA formyltransferase
MRVVLIGQAAFAERVLEGLRERGHDVVAVYCPPDRPGARPDPVRAKAEGLGISVRQHHSLKGSEAAREFAQLEADLGVLAYVTQIVPPAVIDAPRLGSICYHPSLLPRYRGGSAINWQIIKGETRTGVTVFWTDAGIDTGPILLQKEAVISPDDTAGSLYYEKLFPLGVEAVLESVDLIASGKAPKVPQDEFQASYDPLCRDEHAEVDWSRSVQDVYNLIRGCDPQPGAYVRRGESKLRLYAATRQKIAVAGPGTVAAIDEHGILIGARGGAIRVAKTRVGEQKIPAQDAAKNLGIREGDRL